MTRVVCLLAFSACSSTPEAKAKPPAPRDAQITQPSALVELLHAAWGSSVRVSSQVANEKIVPKHLVDRDFNTAWNSRTGELAGAWIDVTVGDGAMIHELRLTVGHTGVGPKGEDYFEMNPRIRTVSLVHAGGVVKMAALDTNKRTLQTIELPAPAAEIRLRVDDVEMGSKAKWRETCISELEAWGTMPPNNAAPRDPRVDVGDADTPLIVDIASYCAKNSKDHRDCKLTNQRGIVEPPWLGVGVLEQTEADGTVANHVAIQTGRGWWIPSETITCNRPSDSDALADDEELGCEIAVRAKVTDPDTLAVSYTIERSQDNVAPTFRGRSMTCRHESFGVRCSDPH